MQGHTPAICQAVVATVNFGDNTMIRFEKADAHAKPEVEKFVVRLPGGMRQNIADVARKSRRSMNSEIVARLEQSLAEQESVSGIPDSNHMSEKPILRAVDLNEQRLSEEQQLLQSFRRMDAAKREALLKVLE
jgi:hypothetical protein